MPSAACTLGSSFLIDTLMGWTPVHQHETLQDLDVLSECSTKQNSQSNYKAQATENSQANKLEPFESMQLKEMIRGPKKSEDSLKDPRNRQSMGEELTSNISGETCGIPERSQVNDMSGSLESSQSPCKTRNPEKPNQSYIALISRAILSSSEKRLQLSDIYQWIMEAYPYYHNQDKSWRNSVRHNLSLNECFVKAGRSDNGKGHYWAVHPANIDAFSRGDYQRRRARRRIRRVSPVLGYPHHFHLCDLHCFHQRFCFFCPSLYLNPNLLQNCPQVEPSPQDAHKSISVPLLWPWHQLTPYL